MTKTIFSKWEKIVYTIYGIFVFDIETNKLIGVY